MRSSQMEKSLLNLNLSKMPHRQRVSEALDTSAGIQQSFSPSQCTWLPVLALHFCREYVVHLKWLQLAKVVENRH